MRDICYLLAALALLGSQVHSLAANAAEAKQTVNPFSNLLPPSPVPSESIKGVCDVYTGQSRAACDQTVKATFDHKIWELEYTRKAYEAHHIYTLVVFILVCSIVGLGMYLSFMEFRRGLTQKTPTFPRTPDTGRRESLIDADGKGTQVPPLDVPKDAQQQTRVKLDPSGVEVSSPVLGVVILVISMGFFYLYLKTVYPIEEVQKQVIIQHEPSFSPKSTEAPN